VSVGAVSPSLATEEGCAKWRKICENVLDGHPHRDTVRPLTPLELLLAVSHRGKGVVMTQKAFDMRKEPQSATCTAKSARNVARVTASAGSAETSPSMGSSMVDERGNALGEEEGQEPCLPRE
jgi:hypothetical protein